MDKTNGCDRYFPFSVLFVGKSGIKMWAFLLVWSQDRKQEGERGESEQAVAELGFGIDSLAGEEPL